MAGIMYKVEPLYQFKSIELPDVMYKLPQIQGNVMSASSSNDDDEDISQVKYIYRLLLMLVRPPFSSILLLLICMIRGLKSGSVVQSTKRPVAAAAPIKKIKIRLHLSAPVHI